ncbi:hypothetical protein appser11_6350 [Actinobacillus pleuropneumoniae serovar 11 str. 56153]|nr:hypothetical protein appser9_6260 [Actinobacillus pleuropneumoniae serovar 9 str. CVJ13261]EFM99044.1 hypothetical protein appser11_6350 [Actinobacillus pleuropneumoniae serovar 11 str. 56153]
MASGRILQKICQFRPLVFLFGNVSYYFFNTFLNELVNRIK